MRTWIGPAFSALLTSLAAPLCVSACDCAYPGAPCKAFVRTPYVFSGRVTQLSTISVKMPNGEAYKDLLVFFQVGRNYRGLEGKTTAEVVTGSGGTDCGYNFREGELYLVYAYPHPTTGKLYSGICTRTRRLAEAGDDLEYFAHQDDPVHGAGIEGWIEELARGADNNIETTGPLKGARVKIEGQPGSWTVITGSDGRFRLWGLKPGAYRVSPEFSPKFVEHTELVRLKEPNSCEEIGMLATPPPRGRSTAPRRPSP